MIDSPFRNSSILIIFFKRLINWIHLSRKKLATIEYNKYWFPLNRHCYDSGNIITKTDGVEHCLPAFFFLIVNSTIVMLFTSRSDRNARIVEIGNVEHWFYRWCYHFVLVQLTLSNSMRLSSELEVFPSLVGYGVMFALSWRTSISHPVRIPILIKIKLSVLLPFVREKKKRVNTVKQTWTDIFPDYVFLFDRSMAEEQSFFFSFSHSVGVLPWKKNSFHKTRVRHNTERRKKSSYITAYDITLFQDSSVLLLTVSILCSTQIDFSSKDIFWNVFVEFIVDNGYREWGHDNKINHDWQ